ncbi:MAG TPA: hypothetical protein VFY67_17750 [Pyrinomonadaceae bacterium]|nr:hypothetical protein [Pyrinomonadaceae bacterium]
MNGLRIYSQLQSAGSPLRDETFYSRRGDGPYYEWRYEKGRGRWMVSRINAINVSAKDFTLTPWKSVPDALKLRLSDHYSE